jgi:hypothetical protein
MATRHEPLSISDQEIQDALKYQKEHSDWNLYLERELLESVLSQRVNFMIATFALFLAAAASLKTKENLMIILGLGAIFDFLLFITIYRIHIRQDIVIRMLYRAEPQQVLPMVKKEIDLMGWRALRGVTRVVHIWIPVLCITTFFVGFILAWWDIIKPNL